MGEIARIHEQQALSYLKASGLELAIVINFGAERVQSSRVVYTSGKAKIQSRLPKPRPPIGEKYNIRSICLFV